MKEEFFPRGSEWRRWDLHVHTPGTQKNDQYKGSSLEEKWNNFYNAINNYVGNGSDPQKNIAVIGITDYLSVDNYFRVKEEKRLPSSVKLVLPNVELRMSPLSEKGPVNIHFIFSPELSKKYINSNFFAKLKFESYSATEDQLIELGRKYADDNTLCEKEAYKAGINQFIVEIGNLEEIFNNNQKLRENTIIGVSNNSKDGASGINKHSDYLMSSSSSQLDLSRQRVYRFADLIFSGNSKDRDYFLGLGSDSAEEVKRKCGSLKGCIHGSDAHCLNNLFEPNEKRYCWIKADPTFNGLKQIIYEPKTRVAISPLKPEKKSDYQVIDRVEIEDDKFQSDPILLNDHLTCIIGGKSTGKSLLLHNIANAIDSNQVTEKAETIGINPDGRNLEDVKVYWNDGVVSTTSQQSDHKIVYIPQTYLNRLSDEGEEVTEIDKMISDIVLINVEAQSAYNEIQKSLKTQKTTVERLIYDLIQARSELDSKKEKLSEIGTKEGIAKEIKRITDQKNKLAKTASISENEIKKYDVEVKQVSVFQNELQELESDLKTISALSTVVQTIDIDPQFSDGTKKEFQNAVDIITENANKQWQELQGKIVEGLDKKIKEICEQKKKSEIIISKIKPKITENETIKKLSESLQKEEEKFNHYTKLKNELKQINEKYINLIDSLIEQFLYFETIHKKYENVVNKIPEMNNGNLEFKVETPFRKDAFTGTMSDLFDNRSLRSHKDIFDFDIFDESQISPKRLKKLIEACLNGDLKITKRRTPEDALRQIFVDWYNSTYSVQMDGDSINEMSPGKKALVLLKMLINMAESTCPILIDQPEDDLDNRSIFTELIPFIKEKKTQRQIIIVTHNANVVLGSDAEEIIVANQNGNNAPNKEFRFEYRTGAIEEDRQRKGSTDVLGKSSIQKHICDILEGGKEAFDLRKHKYQI